MKLIGSKTEKEYRDELISSRQMLYEKQNQKLLTALRSKYSDMEIAHVLSWTPEQGEDIYRILINTNIIAAVEVSRHDIGVSIDIESISLKEYEKKLGRTGRIKLAFAIDLAESTSANEKLPPQ